MEEIKQRRLEYLKHRRNSEEIAPIEIKGHKFDFDETAQMRLLLARDFMIRNIEGPIPWTTADNETVMLEVSTVDDIIDAAALRCNAVHVKYRELYAQVMAAESYEEVMAIDW